jgi:acyl-CoA thioester hydrolase
MNSEAVHKTLDIEVRYAETDQMGIVHHSNYVVWLELARTGLCALSGHHYADIERRGFRLVVTKVELRYVAPARYGDTVQVHCWIDREGSRGVRFAYEVKRGEDRLASGATEHIWCNHDGRPVRAPEELRKAFAAMATGEA